MVRIGTCVLISLFFLSSISGQRILESIPANAAHICELPAPEAGNINRVSKPYRFSQKNRALNYNITYVPNGITISGRPCKTFPNQAKTALDYAASIWSDVLNSENQQLGILACWTDSLGANTLGSAGSNGFLGLSDPGFGLEPAFFPVPLAEYLLDDSLQSIDIVSFYNATRNDWYFGTDANTPGNNVDFVSVALHEIGHGLGFAGSASVDTSGNGLLGFNFPMIFDVFVDDNAGDPITDLTSPGPELYAAYTGGPGSLFFDDSNLNYFRSPEQTMELYTPPTFSPGSSYSHFSEANLGGELMSPTLSFGQAIHTPNLAEIVLKEIGWNFIALPIQLLSFVVNEKEDGHFLEWETDYEYNNDHFDIERSLDGISFELVGEVPAIDERTSIKSYAFLDTKAPQGLSYYRLKQVDIDGSFSYSETITAFRKEKFAAWQIGPNPATEALELILPEELKSYYLSIFDASGALQMTMNGHENRQKIDISGLSPGIKYARLSDEAGVIGWKNFLVIRP